MPMIDAFLAQLGQEAVTTRRLLERLPASRLTWRPHAKSFTLGQLALHIASIAPGVAGMAMEDTYEAPDFHQAEPADSTEVLKTFDRGVVEARGKLSTLSDAALGSPWTLTRNGQALMTFPRVVLVRTFLLNQLYHHRGQLTVYLRQLDVPLPSIYGPTADESPFA